MSYQNFLARKKSRATNEGIAVTQVHPFLHQWQGEIVAWAARVGRAAMWADTGLGKTVMQIEWLRHMTGDDGIGLIAAPLAVCHQTVREGKKIGASLTYTREMPASPGLYVTNYEMLSRFDPSDVSAFVLDEASILKNSSGATRTALIEWAESVPYRLACTATPAPNDPEELTNYAEFLGHMSRTHMLAAYYIHDADGWRLKGHGRRPMYQWMSSWAIALRKPSDMGGSDDGYNLPGLEIIPQVVHVEMEAEGQLFATDLGGVGGRAKIRKQTLDARVERAVQLINETHFGAKLTACHGSLNTKKTAAPEWRPTPNTEQGSKSSGSAGHELPKRIGSTSASTTRPTKTPASGSGLPSSKLNITGDAASATPTTPSTESAPRHQSPRLTSDPVSTPDSRDSSGSRSTSTKPCSNSKETPAQSAERISDADWGIDSASTIATPPGRSEDCFAANATLDSASSEITPSSCETQPTTSSLEPWIVWCGLNDEQDALARALGNRAFSITGSMSPDEKVDMLFRWLDGERPVMISKPSILGTGINMQHCARMVFVGLSDSYEQYYQAIRRCYRYGQQRIVHAHIVLSELEGQIAANVARKEREASHITAALVAEMQASREKESA